MIPCYHRQTNFQTKNIGKFLEIFSSIKIWLIWWNLHPKIAKFSISQIFNCQYNLSSRFFHLNHDCRPHYTRRKPLLVSHFVTPSCIPRPNHCTSPCTQDYCFNDKTQNVVVQVRIGKTIRWWTLKFQCARIWNNLVLSSNRRIVMR